MTIAVLIPISAFALIFGIFYLRSREKMGMIERGMDPNANSPSSINPNNVLTYGCLLMGAGIGLFLASYIAHQHPEDNLTPVYMSLSAAFGGIGLIIAYVIEKISAKKKD